MSKPAVAKSPVFAPSSARARQKYERPIASGSSCTLVCPLSPGGTPDLLNNFVAKPLSAATSNVYLSGRTPLVVELPITRRTGCCDSFSFVPCEGEMSVGGLITTPGMGPAIVGVSGLELFCVWQAPTDTSSAANPSPENRRMVVFITKPSERRISSGQAHARVADRMRTVTPIGACAFEL